MSKYLVTIIVFFVVSMSPDNERIIKNLEIELIHEVNMSDHEIFMPQSVDIDSKGNVVFFDRGLSEIVYVKEDVVSFFGNGKGRGPGEFQRIWDLEVDEKGEIFLTDMDKQKIIKWNLDQSFQGELSVGGRFVRPSRFTLCKDGKTIYLLSAQYGPKGIIHKFNRNGKHESTLMKIKGQDQRLPYYTDGEMACDEEGSLYYSGRYTNLIRKYNADGAVEFEREVIGFEGNEEITVKDGRFTSLADNVKRATGEVYLIEGNLLVAFSGRQDGRLKIIDVYSSEDGSYNYSFELPDYFESYAISKNRIVTFENTKSDEMKLCIYSYSGIE